MLNQSLSDSSTPCCPNRVHRLQLGMGLVELFQGPDPEKFSVEPGAEKRYGGFEQVPEEPRHERRGRA